MYIYGSPEGSSIAVFKRHHFHSSILFFHSTPTLYTHAFFVNSMRVYVPTRVYSLAVVHASYYVTLYLRILHSGVIISACVNAR